MLRDHRVWFLIWCLIVPVWFMVPLAESGETGVQDIATADPPTPAALESTGSATEADVESESSRRQRVGMTGVLILGLIVVLGLAAIAFSMIWGARVRRIIRTRQATATDYDPLWYLRKPRDASSGNRDESNGESRDTP